MRRRGKREGRIKGKGNRKPVNVVLFLCSDQLSRERSFLRGSCTEPQIIILFQLSKTQYILKRTQRRCVTEAYRIGRVRQAVEFLLHVLQDFCGRALLRFAVVDLVQDCVEHLSKTNKNTQDQP